MKNSQLSIEKKFYVKFVEGFSGLFCISITWHYGNLNVKCFFWWYPWNIFKISEKTYFKVKTVFNRGWNFQKFTKSYKTIEFHIGSQANKLPPKIAIFHVFEISGGNTLCNVKFNVKMEFFPFLAPWKIHFWINDKIEI